MSYSSTPTMHTARKAHRCDWCGERINPGERYGRYFHVIDGDAGSTKMHPECLEDSAQAARKQGGWIEWTPGEMERPRTGAA